MSNSSDEHPETPREDGISLEELTAAFAQAMGAAPKPRRAVGDRDEQTEELEPADQPAQADPAEQADPPQAAAMVGDATAQPSDAELAMLATPADEDCCPISPRSILEAMLFVGDPGGQPLSSVRAAELMRDVTPAEIPPLVDELNQRYAAGGCPYCIVSETAGYRLALREAFHALRNQLYGRVRETRLSQAAIDVLAIVAYRQPLTAEQVSGLRGKPSGHVLTQLVRRDLLRIERTGSPRRTAQYFTTDRFLQLFSLESLADLPQSEELPY
jgi:segregation and condensation protein B